MKRAIEFAKKAGSEIPVGAIIVKDGKVSCGAFNMKEELNDVTSHAEILAIREAEKILGRWRLDDCEMYVTLEPCPMCAWAILQSRIKTVYFGSYNSKYGAFGSAIDLNKISDYKTKVYGGIEEEECDKLLKDFFEEIRK